MNKQFKECVLDNLWFKILSIIAILLMITSFFMPPQGVIDPSVLAGTGEIFAFAALWTVVKAIDNGHHATVTHGDTTVTVGKDKKEPEEIYEEE